MIWTTEKFDQKKKHESQKDELKKNNKNTYTND